MTTRTDTELQRIERMIILSQGIILGVLAHHHHQLEKFLMSLDTVTAETAAKVAALAAEVTNANAKTDAALAALAASVASGQPATQAQIDAITAIGAAADSATAALQAEETKVDGDLNPATASGSGDGSAT